MPEHADDPAESTDLDRQAMAATPEDDDPATHAPTPRLAPDLPGDAIPVAHFQTPIAAHMVRCILEAEGIRAAVVGEHSANLLANLGPAVSVSLLVSRPEYERAVAVLHEAIVKREPSDISHLLTCPVCAYDLRGLENKDRCPECGAAVGTYLDLRRHLTIAPPPHAAGRVSFIGGAGAIIGLLLIAALLILGVVLILANLWHRRP
jgi:hypothetical protein